MPMRRIRSGGCAGAASGHAAAAPPPCENEFSPSDVGCHATPHPEVRVHAIEERYHALAKERIMLLRCESLEPRMSLSRACLKGVMNDRLGSSVTVLLNPRQPTSERTSLNRRSVP